MSEMANYDAADRGESLPDLPKALTSRSPLAWLTLFGPGAVVASVTIGTGELIFSTRGGVLFGYNILFLFLFISMLKWVLVFGTSKHLLLTGVHPFQRMMELPGPRGWLPMMLLLMICVVQPIWMSFHSSTLGNYVALLTGTTDSLFGGAQFMWALLLVGLVVALCFSGGYTFMERIQIVVVVVLMVAAIVSLVMYDPNYVEMMRGFVSPQFGDYPAWIKDKYQTVWKTPKWVELTTYVGVIGGAAFDYMAYTTWLREKRWGFAGSTPPTDVDLQKIADDPGHPARTWLKAPVIDCGISFTLIVAFSAVFVASGVELLGPAEEIPDSGDMLGQQSRILTEVHPWLYPLYVSGAILTMFGTLYGTIEIGVAVVTEILRSFNPDWVNVRRQSIARVVMSWHAVFSAFVILLMFNHVFSIGRENADTVSGQQTVQLNSDTNDAPDRPNSETDQKSHRETESRLQNPKEVILVVLRPVNLFTGVLACGIFCLSNLWIEMNHVPTKLRSSFLMRALYVGAGLLFLGLGLKGYWDNHDPEGGVLQSRWFSMSGIVAVTLLSVVVVRPLRQWMENKRA